MTIETNCIKCGYMMRVPELVIFQGKPLKLVLGAQICAKCNKEDSD